MKIELVLAALRHSLTAVGVGVIQTGYATETTWETLTGAILVVVGFGWSAYRKWAREQDA